MSSEQSGQQVVTNNLPDYIVEAGQENLNIADQLGNQPYTPYGLPRIADFAPDQQAAMAMTRGVVGMGQPNFAGAVNTAEGVSGYQPLTLNSGAVNAETAALMNPYNNDVINATMSDMDRARQMAITGGEDARLRSGSYGGARHGVADSLTNEAFIRQSGQMAGQLRQQGFGQAQQAALGMAQANQGADLSGAGMRLSGAGQMANLTDQARRAAFADIAALDTIGQQQQGLQQRGLDMQYGDFTEQRDWNERLLNFRLAAIGQTPYETSQSQPLYTNPGMNALGGGLAGAQLAGYFGNQYQGAGAALGGLLGYFG